MSKGDFAQAGAHGARQDNVRYGRSLICTGLAAAFLALVISVAPSAYAATLTVTTTADDGTGSLRQAMIAAAPGDVINFSVAGTIGLLSTLPTVTGSVTITGPVTSPGITIDGGGLFRMTVVASGATLNLKFLTIAHGFVTDISARGGAIFNDGTLTVTNCTFAGNRAIGLPDTERGTQAFGGAIYSDGALSVANSTFSDNVALGDPGVEGDDTDSEGGAIENIGALTITNSTFSENQAAFGIGSGAVDNVGTIFLTNDTFYGNEPGAVRNLDTLVAANCTFTNNLVAPALDNAESASVKGSIFAGNPGSNCNPVNNFDSGYNISDDGGCGFTQPTSVIEAGGLDTGLRDNGGPTQTVALLAGSPAIDAIPVASCTDQATPPSRITVDQRGVTRPQGAACDIGAFEYQAPVTLQNFKVTADIDLPDAFLVAGGFSLAAGSPALNPVKQKVSLTLGTTPVTIPAGSFHTLLGVFVFTGKVGGVKLAAAILPLGKNSYLFTIAGNSLELVGITNPVPVSLQIGANLGSTSVKAYIH